MQQCNKSIQPCSERKLCQQALTSKWKSRSCGKHWHAFLVFARMWVRSYLMRTCAHRCPNTRARARTGADTIHNQHQQSFKHPSIFNSKCLFIQAVIPSFDYKYKYVPKCELSFLCPILCVTTIWCAGVSISLCLFDSVVMCSGYQVCESRQHPALASHHTESSFDGSAASSSLLCCVFFFFFLSPLIWQPNTINYSTW